MPADIYARTNVIGLLGRARDAKVNGPDYREIAVAGSRRPEHDHVPGAQLGTPSGGRHGKGFDI